MSSVYLRSWFYNEFYATEQPTFRLLASLPYVPYEWRG